MPQRMISPQKPHSPTHLWVLEEVPSGDHCPWASEASPTRCVVVDRLQGESVGLFMQRIREALQAVREAGLHLTQVSYCLASKPLALSAQVTVLRELVGELSKLTESHTQLTLASGTSDEHRLQALAMTLDEMDLPSNVAVRSQARDSSISLRSGPTQRVASVAA